MTEGELFTGKKQAAEFPIPFEWKLRIQGVDSAPLDKRTTIQTGGAQGSHLFSLRPLQALSDFAFARLNEFVEMYPPPNILGMVAVDFRDQRLELTGNVHLCGPTAQRTLEEFVNGLADCVIACACLPGQGDFELAMSIFRDGDIRAS